ncbi:SDR family NAD(P)-dependent oxidoreductase [Sphingomonadaceae bacterium G21617-S1]|nr:SDR family NAD(P)-dependent oxidoreductase [Sphingomonadaceae bacterium G21617-S1]
MHKLENRVILVTGASGGLGAHFATLLASHGARVVLAARRLEALESVQAAIEQKGGRAASVQLDVVDEASTIAAYDFAEHVFGPVDSVVANAGINNEGAALDLIIDDFEKVMAVNVRGSFLTIREGARRMIAAGGREREHGRIVVIASIMGQVVKSGMAPYCASKAALIHMTKALAREWARSGISINALCPGFIPTELNAEWFETEPGHRLINSWPRRRLMQASALDELVVHLSSDAARCVTGSVFTVDDGQTL